MCAAWTVVSESDDLISDSSVPGCRSITRSEVL